MNGLSEIYVGGGCFWCLDAIYRRTKGIEQVICGFSGGIVPGIPTYREVSSGKTGHVEVVKVSFHPNLIGLEEVLMIFFNNHDPSLPTITNFTYGSQYQSTVFYKDENQKNTAEKVIKKHHQNTGKPIHTVLKKFEVFYPAEDYHQNYYHKNKEEPYCKTIIAPKLKNLKQL